MNKFISKTIYIRLVQEDDSEFICSLRANSELNNFLSPSANDVNLQKEWIKKYKERESRKEEFYYIIYKTENNEAIGTIRLYDFQNDIMSFCWGSWILNENKTRSAAIESALLAYYIGFEILGFEHSHFDVMKGNDNVHSFHRKMGAEYLREDQNNVYYTLSLKQYHYLKDYYKKFTK
ncbi:GNAT family N-acetyltransferase [Pasteurella sp. PK-2025]|uniref:GNAT family N-acetyltransferase n=1 Tax=Pasteurella sp. PK-2025 TaxID=3413133 RepID=UPI003C72D1DA